LTPNHCYMKQILFVLLVAISTGAAAQKVDAKLHFQKGKLDVITVVDRTSTFEVMSQSMESIAKSTTHEILDVQNVSGNAIIIEHKLKRLIFSAEQMGQNQTFDSEKDEDRKGEMGKMIEKNLKDKYTMTVDNTGKIITVTDDQISKGKNDKNLEGMADMIGSQLGINLTIPKAGAYSMFKILPNKTIALGDAWVDTNSTKGITRKTMYRVNTITNDEIILDVTEETTTAMVQQMMGQNANVNMTDKFKGRITIDKKTGLLKKRTGTSVSEGTVEAQGMTIPMTAKTSITTTVKPG
jgi:hypothetical protein